MSDYLSWNGQIKNDGAELLPEGEYTFTVTKVDKTTSQSSGAPMAVVTLQFSGPDDAAIDVYDYLVLTRSAEWKLSAFFRAIGLKKHGEPFMMDWDAAEGCTGRAELYIDEFEKQSGGKARKNKVQRYIDKDAGAEMVTAVPVPASTRPPRFEPDPMPEDDIPY